MQIDSRYHGDPDYDNQRNITKRFFKILKTTGIQDVHDMKPLIFLSEFIIIVTTQDD